MLYKKICKGEVCKNALDWTGILLRFAVSIIFDVIDFFVGHIPIVGTMVDFMGGAIGLGVWGPIGLIQFWEVVDITDQIDSWIPTMTISGIIVVIKELLSKNDFQ